MKRYINTKINNEVETIDFLNSNDFSTIVEFRKELRRLVSEYTMAYNQSCYSSCRATKTYLNK